MTSTTHPVPSRAAEVAVVYWLPLDHAVAHFEAKRAELVAAVKRGELRSRRIFCGDDMAVALSSAELLERYRRRSEPLRSQDQRVSTEVLRDQARELEKVRAHLEAADRVERSLQRYADRLEAELAKARKEALTLARALGRAEQIVASQRAEPRRILDV